jgi:multiple sugar transport system permease protein
VAPSLRSKAAQTIGQTVMLVGAIVMVAPVVWMLSTSLKPEGEVLSKTPKWIPETVTLENYQELAARSSEFPVGRWFLNSLGISFTATFLALLVTSMAAYAFARIQWKGRDAWFMAVISTMMIPAQIFLIPVFLIVQKLGWFNTYPGLIAPGLASAFGVFLLRQFFIAIPIELEEAAWLDGASHWTIYSRIIIPIAKPALATLGIFTFLGSWNDFVLPLILTSDVEMRTLPVGLTIFQGRFTTEYGITMAAAAVATLPVVIAFLFFQKRITEGIALTGLKG